MTRRQVLALGLCAPFLTAAARDDDTPAFVLVLVDLSLSVDDRDGAYHAALTQILAKSRPGDSVRLAAVRGSLGKREASAALPTLPEDVLDIYSNPIVQKKHAGAFTGRVAEKFSTMLKQPRLDTTELIRSLRDAGRQFAGAKAGQRKILTVLSDMLEDSREYHFKTTPLTPAYTKKVLAGLRASGDLAALDEVDIYVFPTGRMGGKKADEVEDFWMEYFQACGARLSPDRYGASANYRLGAAVANTW
jgi:hypothetical protein